MVEKLTYAKGLRTAVANVPDTVKTTVPLTDEDVRIMKSKEDMLDQAKIDMLFYKHLHPMNDPVRQDILRRVMPGPFQRVQKYVSDLADLQKEVQLKLLDELSEESIMLRIAIAENPEFQSLLSTPVGPMWVEGDEAAQKTVDDNNQVLLKRGLLSIVERIRMNHAAGAISTHDGAVGTIKAQHEAAQEGKLIGALHGHPFTSSTQIWGLPGDTTQTTSPAPTGTQRLATTALGAAL